jgi:hypothetical protein
MPECSPNGGGVGWGGGWGGGARHTQRRAREIKRWAGCFSVRKNAHRRPFLHANLTVLVCRQSDHKLGEACRIAEPPCSPCAHPK